MKYLLTLATLLFFQISSAQNLVQNGDFETYSNCPDSLSELYECTGWVTGSSASPDYYNSCDSIGYPSAGVPQNTMGYQWPASGNGYAGIIAYHAYGGYREYLLHKISENGMIVGHPYAVSMKIVLGNKGEYAVGRMGVYFYVDSIGTDTSTYDRLPLTPQIDYGSYGLITDTVNWLTVVDTFVADSAYKHLIIGIFHDSTDIPHAFFNSSTSNNNHAYINIDDVFIQDVSTTGVVAATEAILRVNIFPNPMVTSTTISFNNPQHKNHKLHIYNIEGRLMRKIENITGSELRIERGELGAGCYFYELRSEDGASVKGKLFVE